MALNNLESRKIATNSISSNSTVAIPNRTPISFTAYGNAAISTTQSKFNNTSFSFDGNGDFIHTVNSASQFKLATGTSPFTIEMWVYQTAAGGFMIAEEWTGSGSVAFTLGMGAAFDGAITPRKPYFCYYENGWKGVISSTEISLNTWYHIAGVFTGSSTYLYVDGTEVGTGTRPTTWPTTGINPVTIGRRWDTSTNVYFTGYLDEIRFSKIARYTGNFTPSTVPFKNDMNTICLLHADGSNGSTTIIDDIYT